MYEKPDQKPHVEKEHRDIENGIISLSPSQYGGEYNGGMGKNHGENETQQDTMEHEIVIPPEYPCRSGQKEP